MTNLTNDPIFTISTVVLASSDLPSDEFPALNRIVVIDLVGPLAANKQHKALERRTETLRSKVNLLIANNNLLDTFFVRRDSSLQKDSQRGFLANLYMNLFKIVQLADGTIAADSKDAVNGSQLFGLQTQITTINTITIPKYLHRGGGLLNADTSAPNQMTGDLYLGTIEADRKQIKLVAPGTSPSYLIPPSMVYSDAANVDQLIAAINYITTNLDCVSRPGGLATVFPAGFGTSQDQGFRDRPGNQPLDGANRPVVNLATKIFMNHGPLSASLRNSAGLEAYSVPKKYVDDNDEALLPRDGSRPWIGGNPLDMNNYRIINLPGTPAFINEAPSAGYVNTHDGSRLHRGGGTVSPDLTLPNRVYGDLNLDGNPADEGATGGVPHHIRGVANNLTFGDGVLNLNASNALNLRLDGTTVPNGSDFDWATRRIKNASDPVDPQDYVTLHYLKSRLVISRKVTAQLNASTTLVDDSDLNILSGRMTAGLWIMEIQVPVRTRNSGGIFVGTRWTGTGTGKLIFEVELHGGGSNRIDNLDLGSSRSYDLGSVATQPTLGMVRLSGIVDITVPGDLYFQFANKTSPSLPDAIESLPGGFIRMSRVD